MKFNFFNVKKLVLLSFCAIILIALSAFVTSCCAKEPDYPHNAKLVSTGNGYCLMWDANSDADCYIIYRKTRSNKSIVKYTTINENYYYISKSDHEDYRYAVTMEVDGDESYATDFF